MKKALGRFNKITQVGFVVRDMEKVVREMRRVFGVEPIFGKLPEKGKKIRGKEAQFEAQIAFYRFANIELEFVKPISGKSIWQDFLDSGREGIHHIRFSIDDFDGTVDEMKAKGISVIMEGVSTRGIEGLKWGYLDSEIPLGFTFEIFNEEEVCK